MHVRITLGSSTFTLDEFARLMSLLTYDEIVKAAFLRSGQDLSREQLDTNVSRDVFWQDMVAKAYNSEAPITAIDLSAVLVGIRTLTKVTKREVQNFENITRTH